MNDVKIKVMDSDKLIKAINEGSYDINLSAVMALGAVTLNGKPSVDSDPQIIRCKDCIHKPKPTENYKQGERDSGFEIEFPDYICPLQCEDPYYNRLPKDDWFCGNGERRQGEKE